MKLFTIGTSGKNLMKFIETLQYAGIDKLVDVRLNNTSQLAGYSKKDDLEYIMELVGIKYVHIPKLAPTQELLKGYKNKVISWDEYERLFGEIMKRRQPLQYIDFEDDNISICLLCSEEKPQFCHRRLLAEYFANNIGELEVVHL
jgi:uncharacterized protein (DUF488 family)